MSTARTAPEIMAEGKAAIEVAAIGIQSLNKLALYKRLGELYWQGYTSGAQAARENTPVETRNG